MSDTQRTDTLLIAWDMNPEQKLLIKHARELERELNEANEQVDQLKEAWNEAYNCFMEQVDRLVKAKIAKQ